MIRRALVRLLQLPLVLFVTYALSFWIVVAVPGNPFQRAGGRTLSPAVEQALRQRYGMNDNWTFFRRHLGGVLRGDLGQSTQYENWTCNEIVAAALPVSAAVGLCGVLIALVGGVTLGTLAALRPGGGWDRAALAVAVAGVSLPTFVTGALLLVLFSAVLPWLPVGAWGRPADLLRPAAALSLLPMAYITRLTRSAMRDVLAADFIRAARARGLTTAQIVRRHALRNALPPVVQYIGPAAASAMTGSFVVERVFNVPGLGVHFVNAILNRDQMLILATVIVYSSILFVLNMLADGAAALLDPRLGDAA
ncbi:MAG: ABC transporter permease [Phycisphaerae bacterium]